MKEIKDDPELAKKTLKFTNERLSSSKTQRNPPIYINQGTADGINRKVKVIF